MAPTTTRRTEKPAEPATTSLRLRIGQHDYAVRRIGADGRPFGTIKAFRLRRTDTGELHDVAQLPTGCECTCGDFVWRRDGLDPAGCKHVRALKAWGLLG